MTPVFRQTVFVPPVPQIVAHHLGYLESADLLLDTSLTRSSHEQLEQLMSGERDAAVTAIDNLIVWNAAGADIRVVAQVERTTALGVYAQPSIHSLSQLGGARFAVDAASNGFAIVAKHLVDALGARGVQYLEVGGVRERLQALVEHKADVALLGPPVDELAEGSGFRRLASANELVKDFPGQGLVIRASRLAELAPSVTTYLEVLNRAVEWSNGATDEEGVALLAANGFQGKSAGTAWETRAKTLRAPVEGLEVLVAMRENLGFLPDDFPGLGSILDQRLLEGLLGLE